ncbi:hypothetical protein TrRE_jg662, partial [Triparma retinervis]
NANAGQGSNTPSRANPSMGGLGSTKRQLNEGKYTGYRYILSHDLPVDLCLRVTLKISSPSSSPPSFFGWGVSLLTHYCELSPCYRKALDGTDMEIEEDEDYETDGDEGVIVPSNDEGTGGGRRKRYKSTLTFPIAVRDLGLDAQLRVRYCVPPTLFSSPSSSSSSSFQVTCVKIFDSNGRIKQGEYNVQAGGGGGEEEERKPGELARELRGTDYWLDGITSERFEEIAMEGGGEQDA